MVLRPDGAIVVRNQARDARDPELLEVKGSYDRAIKEAGQRRPAMMPGGYGSGSGMMPGMMPGATPP